MNLTELLQRLSELEPEVCRSHETEGGYQFDIREYGFFFDGATFFATTHDAHGKRIYVTGPPALAWLRGAVERAIITRSGVIFSEWSQVRDYRATVANTTASSSESAAHALLAAFVAAVGAAKEGER